MIRIPNQLPISFARLDPSVSAEESPRLSRQCVKILERLRLGPASNQELADIALNYTARCSELKRAGYDVICYERNRETGLNWYRLGLLVAK